MIKTDVGDMISRQTAIDYLTIKANMTGSYGYISAKEIHDYLSCMPSAEPEHFKSCKNCIHLGHAYMMPCKNCKRNQMLPDWYEVEHEK